MFLAAVEADRSLLEGIADALRSPEFPLYLGRRAFPPTHPVVHSIVDTSLTEALATAEWLASEHRRRRTTSPTVRLDIRRDPVGDERDQGLITESVRDVPLSFSEEERSYGWRTVVHDQTEVPNPAYQPTEGSDDEPDFLAAIGGA